MDTDRIKQLEEMKRKRALLKQANEAQKSQQAGTSGIVKDTTMTAQEKIVVDKTTKSKGKETVKPTTPKVDKYHDLAETRVSLKSTPKDWKDEDIKNVNIYGVKQLSISEIVRLGSNVFESISKSQFTSSHVDILLSLAVSLLEPGSTAETEKYVLIPLPSTVGNPIKNVSITASEAKSKEVSLFETRLKAARRNYETADESKKEKLAGMIEQLEADIATSQSSTKGAEKEVKPSNAEDAFVYSYMAAYFLRLYNKTSEAVVTKLEVAKKRAATWYDLPSNALDEIDLSADQASIIREAMSKKPEINKTWVLWCAYNENENKNLSQNAIGMLRYLAIQMFAYTSMHAYSFVVQMQTETGVSFRDILTELCCSATRAGVDQIAKILREYELTEGHPDRKTYFRYARVWDSGYFTSLQTSNCKMLAYVAAKTMKNLSSTNMSDPTEIFALQSVSEKMRSTLDGVADNLYDILMAKMTQDSDAGNSWKI
ncbi:nucleocapsid [Wuhan Insect virus 4]|uniref:Nucleoprotein n=1 Tax=Wuhan Insect virus 4 TaxID=1608109 RepID=A0A0B5KF14_9RHAB|nr:nucleocapsid [Wuhan Insect virus 4]AJG39174.1 nucleocapsid [Wuhan Insect virus 4]